MSFMQRRSQQAPNPFPVPAGNIKTINGLALASVKAINGLALASVKAINLTPK